MENVCRCARPHDSGRVYLKHRLCTFCGLLMGARSKTVAEMDREVIERDRFHKKHKKPDADVKVAENMKRWRANR